MSTYEYKGFERAWLHRAYQRCRAHTDEVHMYSYVLCVLMVAYRRGAYVLICTLCVLIVAYRRGVYVLYVLICTDEARICTAADDAELLAQR